MKNKLLILTLIGLSIGLTTRPSSTYDPLEELRQLAYRKPVINIRNRMHPQRNTSSSRSLKELQELQTASLNQPVSVGGTDPKTQAIRDSWPYRTDHDTNFYNATSLQTKSKQPTQRQRKTKPQTGGKEKRGSAQGRSSSTKISQTSKLKRLKERMTQDEARSISNASIDRKKADIINYLYEGYFGTSAPPKARRRKKRSGRQTTTGVAPNNTPNLQTIEEKEMAEKAPQLPRARAQRPGSVVVPSNSTHQRAPLNNLREIHGAKPVDTIIIGLQAQEKEKEGEFKPIEFKAPWEDSSFDDSDEF